MGAAQAVQRQQDGNRAEDAAAQLMVALGYRIRHRNFRCRYGELDIVAERGETVAFVEVRMWSNAALGDPSLTVSRTKQRKVVRAALHYQFAHDLRRKMLRFDVISVVGRGEDAQVDHLPNAFDAGM
jgi:putative endonuclease